MALACAETLIIHNASHFFRDLMVATILQSRVALQAISQIVSADISFLDYATGSIFFVVGDEFCRSYESSFYCR